MITAGVDLATEASRTALAIIEWRTGRADVRSLSLDVTDADITSTAGQVTRLGIDCPLGWPDDFVRFLGAHHTGSAVAPTDVAGKEWRRRLAYRETDRAVSAATGLQPLSVAADRIGLTAMRAAELLARLAAEGRPVDRSGNGVVVEVYPAASLRCWGLPHRGYKRVRGQAARERLVESLAGEAPWLRLGEHGDLCIESDDALDAVLAALTSRAAALSLTARPTSDQEERARREGWIVLPTGPLSTLPGA